jgi:hypothetical protein
VDLSPPNVDRFLGATIEAPGFAQEVAGRAGIPPEDAGVTVDNLASEARLAARMLATLDPGGEERILEVGAGAGVVAAFLHREGADLVAIEPQVSGFEPLGVVRTLLSERVPMPAIEPLAAEQLDPRLHGRFDLIFSVTCSSTCSRSAATSARSAPCLPPAGG